MSDETKTVKCPLCGHDGYQEPELDEDIKESFIESILGNVAFSRIYDELGGRISIRVASLTDEINRNKLKVMTNVVRAAELSPDLRSGIPMFEAAMDTDGQVLEVSIMDKSGNVTRRQRVPGEGIKRVLDMDWSKATTAEAKNLFDEAMGILEGSMFTDVFVPMPLLRGAVGKHNLLMNNVLTACFDKNFITGTGRDY